MSTQKTSLHIRNRNRERYDLTALIKVLPELNDFIKPNKYGNDSIDFAHPKAVKLLNKSILKHYYGITYWDFPDKNLCPPIPGRADYIHQLADLLSENNSGVIPLGNHIKCLDIGVGANCVYPIIGVVEYGWNFIGSDIDAQSIESAQKIVDSNTSLKNKIICKIQPKPNQYFKGVLLDNDKIDLSFCNPPFHSSKREAQKGTQRKVSNLSGKKHTKAVLNFAGIGNELICKGGEALFIQQMIKESELFAKNCFLFSTLVSKQSNLPQIYRMLGNVKANHQTIPMGTSNKSTRIVAWTFLTKKEQKVWKERRWG